VGWPTNELLNIFMQTSTSDTLRGLLLLSVY
jgi:hypothetical protein